MESLEQRLRKLDKRKIKNKQGKTLEMVMKEEGLYLRSLIQKYLNDYLATDPVLYAFRSGKRTGDLQKSIVVEDLVTVKSNGNRLEIYVHFDEKSYHSSGFGIWNNVDRRNVNVAELLNYGYRVEKDVWFKNLENFGWRLPAHFLEQAIAEFNATNSLGITITEKDITRT